MSFAASSWVMDARPHAGQNLMTLLTISAANFWKELPPAR
jgi:hypothetical protein